MQSISVESLAYQSDSSSYARQLQPLQGFVWLDSGKPASAGGRFDILTAQPDQVFTATTQTPQAFLAELEKARQDAMADVDFAAARTAQLPFCGGLLGYLDYEFNHHEFRLPHSKTPTAQVGFYSWALVQDHQQQAAYLVCLPSVSKNKKAALLQMLTHSDTAAASAAPFNIGQWQNETSRQQYFTDIDKIHRYIYAGDTYQVNYAQRFSTRLQGEAFSAYRALREAVPSPFSAWLDFGDDKILSISPERFITLDGPQAKTQPIKGTAPRGETEKEDRRIANELLNSEKNRAENLMIVDLLRNDFSKNCRPHSVQTPRLFDLETYANVHHLVSTVVGELEDGVTPLKFFLDCFPGGSITGAPKKRAMEIIDELEPVPRQIYCGSVFYLSTCGRFDSNIAIRTLLLQGEQLYCWGGGGIVADSEADDEYTESQHKVAALMQILTTAGTS